jgi:hypothetical protein
VYAEGGEEHGAPIILPSTAAYIPQVHTPMPRAVHGLESTVRWKSWTCGNGTSLRKQKPHLQLSPMTPSVHADPLSHLKTLAAVIPAAKESQYYAKP